MNQGDLSGKTAIITGAGSGMGEATARAFAREGASVGVADVNMSAAKAVAESIVAEGAKAIPIHINIAQPDSNLKAVETVMKEFGALHIAHLHAGGGPDTTILNGFIENFDKGIAITLRGCFLGMVAVAPAIRDSGGGSIIVTASAAGLIGQAGLMSYTAAKHGVIGLVKSAAVELAPHNICVNAVCPAVVHSGIFSATFPTPEDLDKVLGGYHLPNRVCRPEEVAHVVTFLASDKASFITGCAHRIDGGMLSSMSREFHQSIEDMMDTIENYRRKMQG